MAESEREVWITGVGIVSCLGEGPDAHWQRLSNPSSCAVTDTFAPFVVHPLAPINFDEQIPKKGDQRQMEPWQRIGTYAAGLALENAGAKGNAELLAQMDMIVAAGGGERDIDADSGILSGLSHATDAAKYLNERLMSDLRPTLFLAQLSNLLAGNISIVHGVTGSSRTFMGEEAAGVDAVRIGLARIKAGQSDIALVGGAYNAERKDMLMLWEFGGFLLKESYRPVWQREPKGGFAPGSLGAFLVIEEREHAERRGAKPLARLVTVLSDRSNRQPGEVKAMLDRMWDEIAPKLGGGEHVVISGATGAEPATGEERRFLQEHPDIVVRATGTHLGHGVEPQFVMNIAVAALALSRGKLFPPGDESGVERAWEGTPTKTVVTAIGHWRGEGIALLEAVT